VEFGQMMMDVIGDLTNNPSPIEIKLFGNDETLLKMKAAEVKSLIENVRGVVDAFDGIVIAGPSLVVRVDPYRSAREGLTTADIQEETEVAMRGSAETSIQKYEKLIPVRVRYPDVYRSDARKIEDLQIVTPAGAIVPLRTLATVERTGGQAEVDREGLRRMVAVTARIEGRDLGRTVDDIKALLSSRFVLPQGMTMDFGGVYQTQQESFRGLLFVALAAVLLVFLVLLYEFGEFAVPLSVLMIGILSLSGVFGALWLTGMTLNISSFVGLIMVIGIVAENAIFLMHTAARLKNDGMAEEDALVRAGMVRARPILMTTLAAVLALLPLSLGIGGGAQMQQPLAIAVIGGFSVSSLLLFFALPVVYHLLHGRRSAAHERQQGG
jgi:multidrug efflux pump subunit AcrB